MGEDDLLDKFETELSFVGSQLTDKFNIEVTKVTSSYIKNGEAIVIVLFNGSDNSFFSINENILS
jgi:hypothetical protein